MCTNEPPLKPYLKWAGGKRQLLSEIKKYLPGDMRPYTYYEPFAGAGAVFFAIQPSKAVVNDNNTQLMLTYTAIKENIDDLVALLRIHEKKNNKEYYYTLRNIDRDQKQFNALPDIEKAARLIFLNKTCYNGLYRVNARGFFNVPYGRYMNPAICDERVLRQISGYLNTRAITIMNADFESAIADADAHSFIYFDPPYHRLNKTSFTGYQAAGFDDHEQRRLRAVMEKMTGRGVKCLLSNSDTEYIRALYSDDCFDIIPVRAKRPINARAAERGAVTEVLIKNWKN